MMMMMRMRRRRRRRRRKINTVKSLQLTPLVLIGGDVALWPLSVPRFVHASNVVGGRH